MRYANFPITVYAFHGCDESVAEAVFAGKTELKPSKNNYDWLGSGIYFWENAPERALRWAQEQHERNPDLIRTPAVVGAVVHLGTCLNLMDKDSNQPLKDAYNFVETIFAALREKRPNIALPENKNKLHMLDSLVLNLVCAFAGRKKHPYDTVRAAFVEGDPVFKGSAIRSDTHIQLCVRNPASIVAYFRPRENLI
jgi:hypothetical protein